MPLFGGSKKKTKGGESGIPEVSEFPLKGYVYRQLPERVGKVQIAGRIPGDFDGFTTQQDLEDMVARVCGGGTYRVKCVKAGETKTHIGYHNFTIPGAPLVEGQPIDGEAKPSKKEEPDRVNKIESEIEIEEAQARLDETRARRAAKRKALHLDDGDDDDDDSPAATPAFGMPGFEDPRVTALLASQKAMEKRLEEKDREMERERHKADIEKMQAESRREMEKLRAEIAASANNKGSTGGEMMAAQMKAIEAVVNAGQSQTAAMLASNSELIKVMMSRDPSAGINDRVDKLVDRLLANNSSGTKEQLEIMKESFNTGIMMAKGGESAPTSMADVAREFSGKVLDTAQEFIRQKGSMSKEVLAQEIQKAVGTVMNNIKGRLPIAALTGGARALPPGGQPAMPRTVAPTPQPAASILSTEEIRNRVDKVMVVFLEDMQNETENWPAVAQQQIPPEDYARLRDADGSVTFENVAMYAMSHGSPNMVQQVLAKLEEIGALTPEQVTYLMTTSGVAATATAPAAPQVGPQYVVPEKPADLSASATSESDGEVTADDNDSDALMGDDEGPMVAQGNAIPAQGQ